MAAGPMRDRVRIESKTETRDAHGGVIETWAKDSDRWVSIRPRSGNEFYAADQTKANITHLVLMRYDKNLTTSKRIVHGARTLNIESVLNRDGKRIMTEALCIEQEAGA